MLKIGIIITLASLLLLGIQTINIILGKPLVVDSADLLVICTLLTSISSAIVIPKMIQMEKESGPNNS